MSTKGMAAKTNKRLKFGLLLTLVLQTTGCVLLLRYSRHRTKDSKNYLVSTTVVSSEAIKVITSLIVLLVQTGGLVPCLKLLYKEMILNRNESAKSAVPALSYTVQNNLLFVALSHLDSVTYQVTYQLKILVTAIFSVLMLNKRLSSLQWVSLIMLMIGVIAIQLPDSSKTMNSAERQNDFIGLICVLISCFLSGFTGVYFEKILKKGDQSLWIRNFQLSFLSSLLAMFNALVQDYDTINSLGFFYGYNYLTWTVISIHAFGGFIVAFVMKYADNILKGFATSISIVVSTVISFYILDDFSPQPYFIFGAPMVLAAIVLYGY